MNKPQYYIGVDTHKYTHTACIINNDNDTLLTFDFKNQPQYFNEALKKIKEVTKYHLTIFGLEDTQSFGFLFSNYLNEKGYEVKQVNPALANAIRKAQIHYKKTDEYDSYCVAKVLRDDYKRLPSFQHEMLYENIRLLVSQRKHLARQRGKNFNTLHNYLAKVYPGYAEFFCNLQTRSALAFYHRFPSSKWLKGFNAEELSSEMKKHTKIFPKARAEKILSIIKRNPTPYGDEVIDGLIIEMIDDIYNKEERIIVLEDRLERLIEQTGYKLTTIPGVNIATAAEIISEIGDINRFKNDNKLAQHAGIAPKPIGSAGKNKEKHSKSGNRRLRATMHFLAVGMISTNIHKEAKQPYFRDYFLNKTQNGKTKQQALICIMRQLIRIIFSMMKHKTEWIQPEYIQKYKVEA